MDAVGFAGGVAAFFAADGFCPIVEAYGANINADTVTYADIPVYSRVGTVDGLLVRVRVAPDFVTVVFTNNLAFSLKIRVYRQKIHHY